ncbi:rod-determining factor RdfA [Haladaptatus sp. NG-WS-4]
MVQRVIDECELTDFCDTLESYWTGESGEPYSLRELAELLNQKMLRAALTDAGVSTLDGEVENTYRLLTSDNVSSGVQTETENALTRDGLDVRQLKRAMLSTNSFKKVAVTVPSIVTDSTALCHHYSPTSTVTITEVCM